MSENLLPYDGSSDAIESMIQGKWDQFANPDRSFDSGSLPTLLAPTSPSSTDKTSSPHQSRVRHFLIREGQAREGQLKLRVPEN